MRLRSLLQRNLTHFWRTNAAVVAGVATAVSVLTGALVVGDSVRSSLRALVLQRLGNTGLVLASDHFFRARLAEEIVSQSAAGPRAAPVIFLQGVLIHEESGLRAHEVNVYGVDERFWGLHGLEERAAPGGREALVGAPLAAEISAGAGDTLLLRIERQEQIPKEFLYGQREDTGRTVRLVCKGVLGAGELGEFSLRPSQGSVHSVFVPMERLQRDLDLNGGANMVLFSFESDLEAEALRRLLRATFTLEDLGLKVRLIEPRGVVSLESDRILLSDTVASAAFEAAAAEGMKASGVYTYLANTIRAGSREIPYSVVTAADLGQGSMTGITVIDPPKPLADAGERGIWLNEWAWRELGSEPGDTIEMDYFLWEEEGRLETRRSRFVMQGILAMSGDVERHLAPEFPGITDSDSVGDWDPPFPIDLGRIRPQDERYWDDYRTTPKAFIPLEAGRRLWGSRFGGHSSIRAEPAPGRDPAAAKEDFAGALRSRLDPERAGFSIRPVRDEGLRASRGSTDFAEYFLYFSFFLIVAAILLAALFFRLGLEQRAREIGMLRAAGFPFRTLRRLFVLEGLVLSGAGSVLGLLGSLLYAAVLLYGLRTWWVGAVGTQHLHLHVAALPFAAGLLSGIVVATLSIAVTLRGLARNSPRALLAGVIEPASGKRRRKSITVGTLAVSLPLAAILLVGSSTGVVPAVGGFFGAGSLLLVAALAAAALRFRREPVKPLAGSGWTAMVRLGTRNAGHRPGRSLLCVALIAFAVFVIVSVEAFRHDPQAISLEPASGTGGFPLLGRSALPMVQDLNSVAGREALIVSAADRAVLEPVRFSSFRVREGEDVSCLNLYAPQHPRVLGAPASFLESGRFSFSDSLAETPEQRANPWLLLEADLGPDVIPAVGDANTIRYILHRSLGDEILVPRSTGETVRLRLVGALRDSIFQGELLVSESRFLRAFPEQQGFRFFLIEARPDAAGEVTRVLEESLEDWGFDVRSTRELLASFHEVENTYLSTFQSLGGLGLVVGTLGLGTVLLRNVLERRKELALLRAVGYRRRLLAGIVVAENALLVLLGLLAGTGCALLAVLPPMLERGGAFPMWNIAITLGAVLIAGLGASVAAVAAAFRSPLLSALRSE